MKDLNSSKRAETALAVTGFVCVLVAMLIVDVRTQSASSSSSSSTGVGLTNISSSGASTAGIGQFNFSITNSTIRALDFPTSVVTFCNTTNQGQVEAYDNITICVVVGGVAKVLFYPNVEDFSLMQLITPTDAAGAFDLPTQWFQLEYSGVASPAKHRRYQPGPGEDPNLVNEYVVPFWTLIITLDNGYVQSLDWDDGCLGGCSPCQDATCVVNIDQCQGSASCDPKFFLGWFGTDSDGRYLISAGERYSRFRSYSLSSAFSSAYDDASSVAPNPTSLKFQGQCGDGVTQCEGDTTSP